jgi:hypothetical protein
MLREMTKGLLTLCVIGGLLDSPAHAGWMSPQDGQLPPDALTVGKQGSGELFYICRAQHDGGVYPGRVGPLGTCDISVGGDQYSYRQYEVLAGDNYSWAVVYNGEIPFDAIPAGKISEGAMLYICRGDVDSQWYPGNISQSYSGCSIIYDGKEINTPWYEVLVGN